MVQQLINGLLQGSLYSLLAIGFTLIFGVLNMINLAHGEVFMTSGFVGMLLMTSLDLPLYVAFPLALFFCALLGVIVELVCFRPIRREFHYASLVSTIAFGIIISDLVVNFVGSDVKPFAIGIPLPNIEAGGILISSAQILLLLISILSMIGLSFLLQRTKLGRSMRALSENETAAKLLGVHMNAVVISTFVIASILAGIAGMLYAIRFEMVSPFVGASIGLKGLAVMIIGGVGNVYGAMIGGILLGLIEVFAIALPLGLATYVDGVVWGFLILILLFRPSGIMGSRIQTERV